jgi:CubicO group peptidase (beta-lactamase class C family)
MKVVASLLAFTLACAEEAETPPPGQVPPDPRLIQLLAKAEATVAADRVPGIALAIVENGRLAHSGGAGLRRAGDPTRVDADTVFEIMSITKVLIAMTALSLADDGDLDLDAPITDYAPYLTLAPPAAPASIHAAHLMTHTSGYPDALTLPPEIEQSLSPADPDVLPIVFEAVTPALWSPPGAVYNYSNIGYALLGLVAQEAAGEQLNALVEARVTGPAGMASATWDEDDAQLGNHAAGHGRQGGAVVAYEPREYGSSLFFDSYGGWWASANDLAHLAEVVLAGDERVLSHASLAALRDPAVEVRDGAGGCATLGLSCGTYKGHRYLSHTGAGMGFNTGLFILPDDNFAVAVLYNADFVEDGSLAFDAIDLFLGLAGETVEQPEPPSDLTTYAGRYVGPDAEVEPLTLGTVDVEPASGTSLRADLVDFGATVTLRALGGDRFYFTLPEGHPYAGYQLTATFWPGTVTASDYLVTRAGVATRVP